ncbi:MAG TPA: hypothetical protein VL122_06895 [Nitrospirota bacterium]|nr:hypothetical protein [Nitrospirota bacterium]
MKTKKTAEAKSEEESPVCRSCPSHVILKGLAAQKIIEHIPAADVLLALNAYHQIRKLKPLCDIPEYPEEEILTLKSTLKKLQRNDWMSEEDYKRFLNDIVGTTYRSKGYAYASTKHQLRHGKGKAGKDKDFDLDILSFSLIFMLRKKTGKPHFSLVGKFLREQGIMYEGVEGKVEYIGKTRSKQYIGSVFRNLILLGTIRRYLGFRVDTLTPLMLCLIEYHAGEPKSLADCFFLANQV